jgi:hypothetical protein
MSHGRNLNNAATYGDYNNEKIQACTRFTVASSTTIYVNIDTETGTANAPSVGRAFFSLMKEP